MERGRSRSRSRSRAPSRSASRLSRSQFRRPLVRRRSTNFNVPRGIHLFVRSTNTNVQSIVSGTSGILNVTSASNGGFRIDNQVFSGTTMTWLFTLTAATLTVYNSTGGVLTSTNYGVPGVAEFVTLFDNFKITKIDVIATFNKNVSTVQPDANGQFGLPNILMYVDNDDNDYLSLEQILQRENMTLWNLAKSRVEFSFVPKMNFLIANTSGTGVVGVGQLTDKIPFLDSQLSQNSPHFGLKMVMDNPTGSTIQNDAVLGQLSFTFKYHLSFKNVK